MITLPLSPNDPARLGDYELVGRLGSGGQGVVYLAHPAGAAATAPRVAIKLLHTRLLGDVHARARFVRELAVLQRVAGFCTAQMLEANMAGDQPYIVSEFVPGPSLAQLVQDEGPRVGADLDRLAIGSVTALAAIHRAGIVHRDFKPANVLMGPDGPRVIDFGIARALDAGSTLTSQLIGTPAYMAPEQFSETAIGPAADLFAWGATVLYAATGRDPFGGGPLPAVMYRVLNDNPNLSALPADVAEVVASCLAKDPLTRPSAEDTLLWLLGQRNAPSHPTPVPSPRPGPPTPHESAPHEHSPPAPYGGTPLQQGGWGAAQAATESIGGLSPDFVDTPQFGELPVGPGRTPAQPLPAGGYGPLRRTPALVVGLVLASLLAVLDIATLALFIADPALSKGRVTFMAAASAFAVLAIVTIVAAVVAWLGSRGAVLTVILVRLAREGLWAVWAAVELQARLDAARQTQAYLLHVLFTVAVVVLLAFGMRRRAGH